MTRPVHMFNLKRRTRSEFRDTDQNVKDGLKEHSAYYFRWINVNIVTSQLWRLKFI